MSNPNGVNSPTDFMDAYVAGAASVEPKVALRERGDGSMEHGAPFIAIPNFHAVFNDDGYGDHSATYKCPLSRQWIVWNGKNKVAMSQVAFAEFIEDNRLDITDPATADMMEIAQNISASSTGKFKSKINRVNGNVEFGWTENTEASAGDGSMRVPEFFKLAIPVFDAGQKWEVTAKLRYRIKDGNLLLWYDLEDAQKVLEHAIEEVWQAIEASIALPIFNGTATVNR